MTEHNAVPARVSEGRGACRRATSRGRRAVRLGPERDAREQDAGFYTGADINKARPRASSSTTATTASRDRHPARRVPEGLPEDQDELRTAADGLALRQITAERRPGASASTCSSFPTSRPSTSREGRLGAVPVARVRGVQAGIPVDPPGYYGVPGVGFSGISYNGPR